MIEDKFTKKEISDFVKIPDFYHDNEDEKTRPTYQLGKCHWKKAEGNTS